MPETQTSNAKSRYMPLRQAICLIGGRAHDWNDIDANECGTDRDASSNPEGWDRAEYAERQLISWLADRVISAFGINSDGGKSRIKKKRLNTPYFELDVCMSQFRLYPDEWSPIWVDGPALVAKVTRIRALLPQKTKFRWRDIVNEAWKAALVQDPPRSAETLAAHLDQWYLDGPGCGKFSPDYKELKNLAREIQAYLTDKRLTWENK